MAKELTQAPKGKGGLIPWRPFAEMSRLERMFGDFFGGRTPSLSERLWPEGIQEPAVDLFEEKDELVVKAELPGMTKDDIQIHLTDKYLIIKGEKKQEEEEKEKDYYRSERVYGAFTRTLALPVEINLEKARAAFKNGVLEVRLPKSEEAKKKEIQIKVE
ncbi:MAG TPA: Hsp20/alpha crystallin family protein [Candidatus Binatia bacterium]|jgi:HSP20 family protein|nr:Hsp20/alpha crystallin family protein [Candidatus Binatia bacterium]